jgi:hypothetical protein
MVVDMIFPFPALVVEAVCLEVWLAGLFTFMMFYFKDEYGAYCY